MEDFSSIIWVVIFGAAMLFSAVTKKSRKQHSDKSNPHEAWPTVLSKPEMKNSAPREVEETLSSASGDENKRFSELSTNFSVRKASKAEKPRKQLQSSVNTTSEQPNSEDIKHAATEVNVGTEEFDLRKAVIYSEILKPKFDE